MQRRRLIQFSNLPSRFHRRCFLQTTAAATLGTIEGVSTTTLHAAEASGETDHFWYRLAPPGPYIDSQRGSRAFGFDGKSVFLSEDNGQSWPHRAEFADAEQITFSCLLGNGNIVFATRQKLFLSTDKLATLREVRVTNRDGSDYLPHTPQDPEQPGWYFHPLDGVHTWQVGGSEMLIWGNYCNVVGGAAPVNIYYSVDQGRTVKIAYAFGQNPHYQEPGRSSRLLGDPHNRVICRHVHSVAYNSAENAFYACTGDLDRGYGHECHWLRGVYDWGRDSWEWRVLVSVNSNSRYKSGGINFVDGQLYWASDANGNNGSMPHDRGIFRCAPGDLANPDRHERLFNPEYESANMIIEEGAILSAHYAPASPYATGIIVSPDLGQTWAQYDLKELGQRSPVRFQKKNSDGWFRVDLRKGWIDRGEVLFIKLK